MTRAALVPQGTGIEWIEQSLAQGFEVSAAVRATVSWIDGRFHALVPAELKDLSALAVSRGGVLQTAAAAEGLAEFLRDSIHGTCCAIVEDDVARRGDPYAREGLPSAYVQDRVVHWREFSPDSVRDAVSAIRLGSAGYPRNAFVARAGEQELLLKDGDDMSEEAVRRIVRSLHTVIAGVFDDESYLLWRPIS